MDESALTMNKIFMVDNGITVQEYDATVTLDGSMIYIKPVNLTMDETGQTYIWLFANEAEDLAYHLLKLVKESRNYTE